MGATKNKQTVKPTETKLTIKSKSRIIVWYFSNGWLFLPFTLLQVSVTPTWFMHDVEKNGFYHWTRHSCSSNTIHDYHEGRGRGEGGGLGACRGGGDNHTTF